VWFDERFFEGDEHIGGARKSKVFFNIPPADKTDLSP
jgi:hypothetical protein